MSRNDRYGYSRFPQYVSVSERKARASRTASKLAQSKTGALSPIVIEGRRIASTFWGKAWCDNIEAYQDYENRLPRGRSYVRSGSVIDLKITRGQVTALVCGSGRSPYKITITIQPLPPARWEALKKRCLGKIDSLVSLIQGRLSNETLAVLCDPENRLFPASDEIQMNCSCPDWADLCKHLAAVLYGIGARLDQDPSIFFVLRGVDQNELITADVVGHLTDNVPSEIDASALSDVFGIEFDNPSESAPYAIVAESPVPPAPVKPASKRRKPPAEKPPAGKPVRGRPKTKAPAPKKTTRQAVSKAVTPPKPATKRTSPGRGKTPNTPKGAI